MLLLLPIGIRDPKKEDDEAKREEGAVRDGEREREKRELKAPLQRRAAAPKAQTVWSVEKAAILLLLLLLLLPNLCMSLDLLIKILEHLHKRAKQTKMDFFFSKKVVELVELNLIIQWRLMIIRERPCLRGQSSSSLLPPFHT